MATLKDLRTRIASVKSTQKITSAMKMVAAAKLRRAQEQAWAARPYAESMERILGSLAASMGSAKNAPALLSGTGKDETHLVIVASSNRGLCGGFNVNIVRAARQLITSLTGEGKTVKILCVGSKGRDQLKRLHGHLIVETILNVGKKRVAFSEAAGIGDKVTRMFQEGDFDVATLVYARFKSAISQEVQTQQMIPFPVPEMAEGEETSTHTPAIYEYEPEEEEILSELLPRNLNIQIFRALLENAASEQGSRMSAMDNASRNAGEMIDGLSIIYNRSRQAIITSELIEIISGAEAV